MTRHTPAAGLLFVLACLALPARADYYDGLRQFDAGNHARAMAQWQHCAREDGAPRCLAALGRMHLEGRGTPQNFVLAHMYFNLAAAAGDEEARRRRDGVAERMTRDEQAEARAKAAAWHRGEDGQRTGTGAAEGPVPVDGHWRMRLRFPSSSVCYGANINPFEVEDRRLETNLTHASDPGVFFIKGRIAKDGAVSLFTSGEYVGISIKGRFASRTAKGVVEVSGEVGCHGTWVAERTG